MRKSSAPSAVEVPERWRFLLNGFAIKSALLWLLAGIGSIIWLASLPADENNILLFGLSSNRLLLAGLMMGMNLLFLAMAFKWKNLEKRYFSFLISGGGRFNWVRVGMAGIFILGVLSLLAPPYRYRDFFFFTYLRPTIAWLTWGAFLGLLPLALLKAHAARRANLDLVSHCAAIKKPLVAAIAILAFLALLMPLLRLGFKPDTTFWNENGIPLLLTQILISLAISLLVAVAIWGWLYRAPRANRAQRALNVLICLVIWVSGAIFLNSAPVERSHFSPGPFPPNYVYYPLSDALTYDMYAQQALLGMGFNSGRHIGKPLLVAMLVLFHTLARGDFAVFFSIQVAFLALVPAILYLIGHRLHGRSAGLLVALFALFQERNAYQAVLYLSTSHSKMIMSEVPAALWMAVAAYFLILGIDRDGAINLPALGVSAGVIGFSTLVRENTIILVPLPFLLIFFRNHLDWRNKINAALVMLIFMLAAVAPWALRTQRVKGTPFYFAPKIQGVILDKRLLPLVEDETSWHPIIPSVAELGKSARMPSGMVASRLSETTALITADNFADQSSQPNAQLQPLGLGEAIIQHFFHNLVTSFAILPISPHLEDLVHAARDRMNTFPGLDESMRLKPLSALVIGVNLFLVGVGIAVAWRKKEWAGMLPLAFYLVYMGGLALARSSGGRYIVSINWVLLLYFAIGMVQVVLWLAALLGSSFAYKEIDLSCGERNEKKAHDKRIPPHFQLTASFLSILTIGLLIPLTEQIFSRRYTEEATRRDIQNLHNQRLISQDVYDAYKGLMEKEELKIRRGKLLYPRFYLAGEEVKRKARGGFVGMDFPRLHFILLGASTSHVILPLGDPPAPIPDSVDTFVVGCENNKVFFAKLALIQDRLTGQYLPLWWDTTQPDPCLDLAK